MMITCGESEAYVNGLTRWAFSMFQRGQPIYDDVVCLFPIVVCAASLMKTTPALSEPVSHQIVVLKTPW